MPSSSAPARPAPPSPRAAAGKACAPRSSSASTSAAPASTTAASRPRRWSPAPAPSTSPGAAPSSASTPATVRVDMARVKARKDGIVAQSRDGRRGLDAGPGALRGHRRRGPLRGPRTLRGRRPPADGAAHLPQRRRPRRCGPTCPASTACRRSTTHPIMALDRVPEHLVVVGGSYIGLEFAQMLRRFGADVTVVERSAQLLPREDEDVAAGIRDILRGEGIRLALGARSASRWRATAARIVVGAECGDRRAADRRQPRAAGRGPAAEHRRPRPGRQPGVDTDARGYIVVDDAVPHQRRRRLGAGRLQRPRRLHPHLLQRPRDRRRQPVRRRSAPRLRPHPVLRALHRPAARPRRHERGRGARQRPPGAVREDADAARRPGARGAARRRAS